MDHDYTMILPTIPSILAFTFSQLGITCFSSR
jgi:hypothetical protein